MKKLWTDLHSNIHHNQMDQLDQWVEQAKEMLDFWPIAYYPFYMKRTEAGAGLEDLYSQQELDQDWEKIQEVVEKVNEEGYPMFLGYEWQGSGNDGDHNVFFLENNQPMRHPMGYQELKDQCNVDKTIAIPHHVAYQLNSRGKNWSSHDEEFSPFAEIYSSHGCSENDTGGLDMERHLHMGPRTGETCYERGLDLGLHVGCIASGDNHNVPAVYDHGSMCVLSEGNSKEQIWEAMKARRVYGVSRSRMEIDFTIGEQPMGSVIPAGNHRLKFSVCAADAIDRVEILKNNVLDQMVVNSGTWENRQVEEKETIRVKFAAEFGWGPNPRFYKDMLSRQWEGSLSVPGRLVSIEKAWNNFGQKLYEVTEQSCKFGLTTYMSTTTGHWMGPSTVVKEGFVFEVEGKPSDQIVLSVDHYEYHFTIRELMETSRILPQYQESVELAKKMFGDVEHYRDDFYWHNAYKVRLRQAVPQKAYCMDFECPVSMKEGDQYRLRIWLKNGDTAWVSPVFAKK